MSTTLSEIRRKAMKSIDDAKEALTTAQLDDVRSLQAGVAAMRNVVKWIDTEAQTDKRVGPDSGNDTPGPTGVY